MLQDSDIIYYIQAVSDAETVVNLSNHVYINLAGMLQDSDIIYYIQAVSDAETVVNLSNHVYINLAGHASGLRHYITQIY